MCHYTAMLELRRLSKGYIGNEPIIEHANTMARAMHIPTHARTYKLSNLRHVLASTLARAFSPQTRKPKKTHIGSDWIDSPPSWR